MHERPKTEQNSTSSVSSNTKENPEKMSRKSTETEPFQLATLETTYNQQLEPENNLKMNMKRRSQAGLNRTEC